jgi:hypothetical protein
MKIMNKERFKDNTVLENFRKEREDLMKIKKGVDMKEILRKSKF